MLAFYEALLGDFYCLFGIFVGLLFFYRWKAGQTSLVFLDIPNGGKGRMENRAFYALEMCT